MSGPWGVTSLGFRRPTFEEIHEDLKGRLRQRTWLDERGEPFPGTELDFEVGDPLTWIVADCAAELDLLWQELEFVYGANKITGAQGRTLDDLVSFQRISREPARRAVNVVTLWGDPGATIAAGVRLVAPATGLQYETAEAVSIPAGGRADVLVRAMEAGAAYNCIPGAVSRFVVTPAAVRSVTNRDDGETLRVARTSNASEELAADDDNTTYQVVRVADIGHPHRIAEIGVLLKNAGASSVTANLHVQVLANSSGSVVAKSHSLEVTLAAGVSEWVVFDGLEIDVHGVGSAIRVAVVNEHTSTGALEWLTNSTDPYAGGSFFALGSEVAAADALLNITSRTVGAFTSGREEESDAELARRFLVSKGRGASAIPEKIVANVWEVPGVLSVSFRENREDTEVAGLRRRSVELTVLGGATEDIGQCLLDVVAAGIRTEGNVSVLVADAYGQSHTMRFNRPERKWVYVEISLVKTAIYPADGDERVVDAIVSYMGGVSVAGSLVAGLNPGEDVSVAKILAAILSVPGIEDASITLGFVEDPQASENLAIDVDEIAVTGPDYITVEAA